MGTAAQPLPGFRVDIAMQQVGNQIQLNLMFADQHCSYAAGLSIQDAEALKMALNAAIEKAKTTIIKPPSLLS